ncbi:MAG: hypothetical protein AAF730_01300 [Bacteroidota bacterium]
MRVLACLSLCLLIVWRPTLAQDDPSTILDNPDVIQLAEEGLDLLYNMEFEAARDRFDALEARYPEHPAGAFLHALETWWQILIDLSDTTYDDQFYREMKTVLDRSNALIKRNPDDFDSIFFKGAALGFRGRLRSNRDAWFRAARDAQQALGLIFDIAEKDTTNADFIFGLGAYHYFAEALPEKYPIVRPLMGLFPDGDRARGLAEMERVAREGRFIKTEAAYFLFQIHYFYQPDYEKCLSYIQQLHERYPNNALFQVHLGRTHIRWGRWNKAVPLYTDALSRYRAGQTGYNDRIAEQALYYLARDQMGKRDAAAARDLLAQLHVLSHQRSNQTFYKTLGTLRLVMVNDALGQRSAAEQYYRAVLDLKDYSGAHERAKRYLRQPYAM